MDYLHEHLKKYPLMQIEDKIKLKTAVGSPGFLEMILSVVDLASISSVVLIFKTLIGKIETSDGSKISGVLAIIEEINEMLPKNIDFVFGHPMAGREKKGIDYASKDSLYAHLHELSATEREGLKLDNLSFININELGIKVVDLQ